ncbi:MAG: T9SS type A sorting domain-containing protein [Bacteroidetes bacterium]|nr:T9SS type A sorting domain-containing protein [Bacteroidota bacterium]
MKNVFLIVLLLNPPLGGWGACTLCNPPAPLIAITPSAADNSYQSYLTRANFYHFLKYNHSFRASNAEFNDWYNDMTSNSNLGYIETAQERLYNSNFSGARELLDGLIADNDIEGNDINYYNLYANYLEALTENTRYTEDDSLALLYMTYMCPIEYGSSIYKARALYSDIYSVFIRYDDCNVGEMGGRMLAELQNQNPNTKLADRWRIDLFPNPAQNKITLKSKNEKEDLQVEIIDVMGRELVNTRVKIKDYTTDMDVDLLNGVYFIRFTNTEGKINVKKLTIAK